jgi:hypothetical protein
MELVKVRPIPTEHEAWRRVEELYRERGVSYSPSRRHKEVCLATALSRVPLLVDAALTAEGAFLQARMFERMERAIEDGIEEYNDSHTKEDNLALIAQCRSEAAAGVRLKSLRVQPCRGWESRAPAP